MSIYEQSRHIEIRDSLKEEYEKDPRFAALSKEKRRMFLQALTALRAFRADNPKPPAEVAREEEDWREFAFAFLSADTLSLAPYVKQSAVFDPARYRISPVAARSYSSYNPKNAYADRGMGVRDELSQRDLFLDAPIGFVLSYHVEVEDVMRPGEMLSEWEPIAVVGMTPDFKHQVLLVDQLQGGDTNGGEMSDEAKEARKVFKKSATQALYGFTRHFAKTHARMRGIGVRDPEYVGYLQEVQQFAKAGKPTRYSEVAKTHEMRRFTRGEYYLEVFKD